MQKMEMGGGTLLEAWPTTLNNILGVIVGYADLLLDRLAPDDRDRNAIEEIRAAGDRALSADWQGSFRPSARREGKSCNKILDINAVVSGAEEMLHRLIGENVELAGDPESEVAFH